MFASTGPLCYDLRSSCRRCQPNYEGVCERSTCGLRTRQLSRRHIIWSASVPLGEQYDPDHVSGHSPFASCRTSFLWFMISPALLVQKGSLASRRVYAGWLFCLSVGGSTDTCICICGLNIDFVCCLLTLLCLSLYRPASLGNQHSCVPRLS